MRPTLAEVQRGIDEAVADGDGERAVAIWTRAMRTLSERDRAALHRWAERRGSEELRQGEEALEATLEPMNLTPAQRRGVLARVYRWTSELQERLVERLGG